MADVSRAKRSVAGLLASAVKKANALDVSLQSLQKDRVLRISDVQELEGAFPLADAALDKVRFALSVLHELLDLSPEGSVTEKYFLECSNVEDVIDRAKTFALGSRLRLEEEERKQREVELHEAQMSAVTQVRGASDNTSNPTSNQPQHRLVTALKPDSLESGASLAIFRSWRLRFEDYYRTNNMGSLSIENQRAHLRSCISVNIQDTLRLLLDIQDDAPVSEVLDALQTHFGESLNLAT